MHQPGLFAGPATQDGVSLQSSTGIKAPAATAPTGPCEADDELVSDLEVVQAPPQHARDASNYGETAPNGQQLDREDETSRGSSGQAPIEGSGTNQALQSVDNTVNSKTTGTTDGIPVHPTAAALQQGGTPLPSSLSPPHTHPLFPPQPIYGPPSLLRQAGYWFLRITSFILSLTFLMSIVVASAISSIPLMARHIGIRLRLGVPDARRPFYEEERRRRAARKQAEKDWKRKQLRQSGAAGAGEKDEEASLGTLEEFIPTDGGKDQLHCDVGYYARRVGLDMEEFKVQTEDGYILTLWHIYNPREYTAASDTERAHRKPEVFYDAGDFDTTTSPSSKRRRAGAPTRYPVLLIPGLLQSAGAYCCNDDDSLAFYLAKSGYDVWLGNNRCGFDPEHTHFSYGDPRLWNFDIRQMGTMDLPAFISRVLRETGFPKLGLVCHSQGTTETFIALAKDQRPDLGARISVFCALAPAVYAGPLIRRVYFQFFKVLSKNIFRLVFGVHAFIPFMMVMHRNLPGRLYGAIGYRVFSFLFAWTDDRWDIGLRNRMFRFAPVYVSAESMRWWLGRDGFARHKCILATRDEGRREAAEDAAADGRRGGGGSDDNDDNHHHEGEVRSSSQVIENRDDRAWYDARAPPMAFWVAGSDALVDGQRLLKRFTRGREPAVRVVHAKVIDEYEHLDVLWAIDAVEKVGREVKAVIWRTACRNDGCAVPKGCLDVEGETEKGVENVEL